MASRMKKTLAVILTIMFGVISFSPGQIYAQSTTGIIPGATTDSSATMEEFVVGKTFLGKDIKGYKIGSGQKKIAIIGGMHPGSEPQAVAVVNAAIDDFRQNPQQISSDVTVFFVPIVNVDAQGKSGVDGRWSANGTDLNRSFDSKTVPGGAWHKNGCSQSSFKELASAQPYSCNRAGQADDSGKVIQDAKTAYPDFCKNSQADKEAVFYCAPGKTGSDPMAEPETQALARLIRDNNINIVLSYHAPYNNVTVSNGGKRVTGAVELARRIADILEIDYQNFWNKYPLTGQFMDWLQDENVIGVEIELPDGSPNIERNLQAIKEAIGATAINAGAGAGTATGNNKVAFSNCVITKVGSPPPDMSPPPCPNLTSGGVPEDFVFYCQGYPRDKDKCSMAVAACGPTSLAMALTNLGVSCGGSVCDPFVVDKAFFENNWRSCGNVGSSMSGGALGSQWLRNLGVDTGPNIAPSGSLDINEAKKFIDSGAYIVISSTNFPLCNCNHITLLVDVNLEDQTVTIKDPNNCDRGDGLEREGNRVYKYNSFVYLYAYPVMRAQ